MKSVVVAFLLVFISVLMPTAARAEAIQGSGSTFAFPLLQKLSRSYLENRAGSSDFVDMDLGVEYEPVGSLGGILRLESRGIDFAASDFPLSKSEIDKRGLIQFPFVTGAVVPVYNVKALNGIEIKLPAVVLADVYLGKIQNWNDRAIVAANSGVTLPDLRISVVHRKDGSGTTNNWTAFLSGASKEWREKYGTNTLVSWPIGIDVDGGSRMAETVAKTEGAIGYLELGQATRAGISIAPVQNAQGAFVSANADTIKAAVTSAAWSADEHFHTSLVNAQSPDAYPISAVTYVVMPRERSFASNQRDVLRFFKFVLEQGSAETRALGYVPLPASTIQAVKDYWAKQAGYGS